MLEELERRNYAQTTIDCYLHTVEHFSRYFHRSPDQLGPEHIREYQAALFKKWKLAPNTVNQRLAEAWSLALSNSKGVALRSEDSAISSVTNKSVRIPIAHPILSLRSFSRISGWLASIQEDEWRRYG